MDTEQLQAKPQIVTVTNPVELLLAQLLEIRNGNTNTRKEIQRLQSLLKRGQAEEARLERRLDKLLEGKK